MFDARCHSARVLCENQSPMLSVAQEPAWSMAIPIYHFATLNNVLVESSVSASATSKLLAIVLRLGGARHYLAGSGPHRRDPSTAIIRSVVR